MRTPRILRCVAIALLVGVPVTGCNAPASGSPATQGSVPLSPTIAPSPTTPPRSTGSIPSPSAGATSASSPEALFDWIAEDDDALRALGIVVITSALREEEGTVHVGLSTERPDAEDVIVARYGPAIVVEVIDPTGAYLKPRGTIDLLVTDEQGRGLEAGIGLTPLFAEIPLDSIGYQTDSKGRFHADDQLPGPWRLTAQAPGFEPGSVDVDVAPGAVVTATIELQHSS